MTDLIDREEALMAIGERVTELYNPKFVEAMKTSSIVVPTRIEEAGLKEAFDIIKDMPSATRKGKWIKCEDELPPVGEEVLVSVWEDNCTLIASLEEFFGYYPKQYYWSFEQYNLSGEDLKEVKAWMPLPQYSEDD